MNKLNNNFKIKEYETRVFYIIYTLVNKLHRRRVDIKSYTHDYLSVSDFHREDVNFIIRENIFSINSPKIKSLFISRLNKEYIFCSSYQSMVSYKFPTIWLFEDFEEDLDKAIILAHL
jgi:hypothetical protein